jgi:glycosyltransferase involved in cell wall biosynthesis
MAFSIIIPSRNATNLTACVKAVRAAGETARIIVVDDGVDWPEAEILMHPEKPDNEHWGWPNVFRFDGVKPFVFARNCNIGIRAAGEDDVVLLNDDALLESEDGFRALQTAWHEYCGGTGVSLESEDGFRALQTAAGTMRMEDKSHVFGIVGATTNLTGQPLQHRRGGPHGIGGSLVREVPHIAFVCVYIPRRTLNRVGLLDERYCEGYGCEDRDYCEAVNAAGLKVGVSDWCYVDHASLTSSFRGDPKTGGDFSRNFAIFKKKWPEAKL